MQGGLRTKNCVILCPLFEGQRVSVLEGLFPEVAAGGFTRMEPRIQFYSRVRALLVPDHHVLEFGAGRGKFH